MDHTKKHFKKEISILTKTFELRTERGQLVEEAKHNNVDLCRVISLAFYGKKTGDNNKI